MVEGNRKLVVCSMTRPQQYIIDVYFSSWDELPNYRYTCIYKYIYIYIYVLPPSKLWALMGWNPKHLPSAPLDGNQTFQVQHACTGGISSECSGMQMPAAFR